MAAVDRDCDPAEGLRYLMDRAEIADLVYTYALNIRDGDARACEDLFTPNAFFEMFDADAAGGRVLRQRIDGRDAIIDHISGSAGRVTRVCPMIYNLTVRIDGDRATSACTMTAVIIPDGHELVGGYHDDFHWDGGWRFAARRHTILLHRSAVKA